jgi:GGDEF domain-containing protein
VPTQAPAARGQDALAAAKRRRALREAKKRREARTKTGTGSALDQVRSDVAVDAPRDTTGSRFKAATGPDTKLADLATSGAAQILTRTAEGVTKLGRTVLELGQRIGIDDPTRTPQAVANLRAREELLAEVLPEPEGKVGQIGAALVREAPSFLAASVLSAGAAGPAKAASFVGRTLHRAKRGAGLGAAFEVTSGDVLEEGLVGVAKEAALFAGLEAGIIGPLAELILPSGARAVARRRAAAGKDRARVLKANRERRTGARLVAEGAEGRVGPERQLGPGGEAPQGAIPATGDIAPLRERVFPGTEPARRTRAFVGPERAELISSPPEFFAPETPVRPSRPTGVTGAAERIMATSPPTPVGQKRSLRRRLAEVIDPSISSELESAFTDQLTGLRNRDAWLIARPRIEADPNLELTFIDLINFKGWNDIVSREAGDQALRKAAKDIRRASGVPERDIFRAGGDEFVVVSRRGTGEGIGRKIADAIGETPIGDSGLISSARFGVGPNLEAADAAINLAKKAEAGPRFRTTGSGSLSQTTPLPRVLPNSKNALATRKASTRQATRARVVSEPTPTGRAANKPPANAEKGPGGPVDNTVEQTTGKVIPNERTQSTRLKQALVEGEGGFAEATRDVMEIRPETGLSAHSGRIQNQISVGEGGKTLRERLPSILDIYTSLVRRTAGLESAGKKLRGRRPDVVTQNDIEAAVGLSTGSARRAEAFLEYGPGRWTRDGNWEVTGTPGLMEILAPLRGKLNQFRRYTLSKRTIEVGRRDIQTGISLDDAALEVSGATGEIAQAQRQSVEYLRDVARYYGEATDMPAKRLEGMFALGEDYMPLGRVFEGKDPLEIAGGGTVGKPGRVFERLTGSKRRVVDPIEAMVDYTNRLIRAADINRIGRTLVDAAEANPEAAVGMVQRIERIPTNQVTKAAENLQRSAAGRGREMSIEEATELAEALGADQLNLADDVIRVWREGELQAFRVAPSIAKGIRAMQPKDMDMFLQLMAVPARLARAGITLNPGFQGFNIIRDTFDAAIQSQYGFRLGVDSFIGFYESSKATWFGRPSKIYKEFASAGGGFSTERGAGRITTQAQIRKLLPKVESRSGRTIDVLTIPIRHPVQALKEMATPFEEAARIGEFMRAKSKGANTVQSVLASKSVTVDFQQIGSQMQGMAYVTKFLNAGIQSLDTAARVGIRPVTKAIAAKAGGETNAEAAKILSKEALKVYGTAIAGISIPSIYFWAASRDDVEITDLRKSNAGLIYWFYRDPSRVDVDGNPEINRMPKPFLWGQIFGTGMEAILDQLWDEDPEAMARFATGVREQATVNMFPDAIVIPAEQWANKDFFFGTPIVPEELEGAEPALQATDRTTKIARKLGEISNVAPVRLEKVFRDVLGTLPADLLRYVDQSIDRFEGDAITDPAPVAADMLFFGRFTARTPSLSVLPVQTFWENARKSEQALESFKIVEGNQAKMDDLFDRRFEDFVVAEIYEGSRRNISEIRNSIDAVRVMPDALFREGDDVAVAKRQLINEFVRQYVEIARITNEVAAEIIGAIPPKPDAEAN